MSELLYYDQLKTHEGQVWRPVTAWIVQFNSNHWLLNMWGLIVMAVLLPPKIQLSSLSGFVVVWFGSSILLAMSDYSAYVGLSGLLYGWLVWAAYISPYYSFSIKLIFVFGLSAKVIVENLPFSLPFSHFVMFDGNWVSEFIQADVAHLSHAWGLVTGILSISVSWIARRLK